MDRQCCKYEDKSHRQCWNIRTNYKEMLKFNENSQCTENVETKKEQIKQTMLKYEDKLVYRDNVELWGQMAVHRQSLNMRTNCCTQTKLKYEDKLLYTDNVEECGKITQTVLI